MPAATQLHKVHYRHADLKAPDAEQTNTTLEDELRAALSGDLALNYAARTLRLTEGRADQAMINNFDIKAPGVLLEILHLDERRDLPFVRRPTDPTPTAVVHSREVPEDEDAMNRPAYLLVAGNHVAAIEPFSLRVGAIQNYLNGFLQAGKRLGPTSYWKLTPKVEISEGSGLLKRGVSRLEIRPEARLIGDAPSVAPQEERRPRTVSKKTEERVARGGTVLRILELLGATDADLSTMRTSMSTDLGLEAKVVISVRRTRRKTSATLDADDISQAVASLEQDNDVMIVSPDGRSRGRLTTLSDEVEIAQEGGMLHLSRVSTALTGALYRWGGKGIIDLSGLTG